METKLFEIRDRATFIAALAIKPVYDNEADRYLIRRSGFQHPERYVILTTLEGPSQSTYDPFDWTRARTMHIAHTYIIEHWDALTSGQVIDVEYILGETETPKISEQYER